MTLDVLVEDGFLEMGGWSGSVDDHPDLVEQLLECGSEGGFVMPATQHDVVPGINRHTASRRGIYNILRPRLIVTLPAQASVTASRSSVTMRWAGQQ